MSDAAQPEKVTRVESVLCPVCQVSLVMSERQGIEIDYCPKCREVWLDRGELDKIIECSEREASRAGPPEMPQYKALPAGQPQGTPSFIPAGAGPWGNPARPQGSQAGYPAYPPQGVPGYYDDPRYGRS